MAENQEQQALISQMNDMMGQMSDQMAAMIDQDGDMDDQMALLQEEVNHEMQSGVPSLPQVK